MNKTELVKVVAEQAELTQKDAAKAVDALIETISETLAQEEKIQLIGFGMFEVHERAAEKDVTHKLVKKSRLLLLKFQLLNQEKN